MKAADQFNPAKASLDTFIDRVVHTAVAMLVRARQRYKRGNGCHIQSLDSELAATSKKPESAMTADDLARRTGLEQRSETTLREDTEAVERALTQMPEEMRDLCRRLMGGTVASVARDLGVSRRQVRRSAAAITRFMERAGFDLKRLRTGRHMMA